MQSGHDTSPGTFHTIRFISFIRRRVSVGILLPWIAFAASNVAFKLSLHAAQQSSSVPGGANASGFLQTLGTLRQDLLLAGLVLPATVWCVTLAFSERWQRLTSAAIAVMFELVVGCEMVAYGAVGTFLPADTLQRVWHWIIVSHDFTLIALPMSAWREPVFWTLLVVLLGIAGAMVPAQHFSRFNRTFALYLGVCLFTTMAAWAVPQHPENMSASVLQLTKEALWRQEDVTSSVVGRSLPELLKMYRLSSHTPTTVRSQYGGAARGYNVLFFVIESTPTEIVDLAHDPLVDMPNLASLRRHAFVSSKHYTPYPLTNRALFAMFTSMYIQCAAGEVMRDQDVTTPGLVRALKSEGYATGYYGFVWHDPMERDDRMLTSLGFDRPVQPTIPGSRTDGAFESFSGPVTTVQAADFEGLQALRKDLHGWAERQQPFVAAFLPQISHDPWRELQPGSHHSSRERGRALVAFQDGWLGLLLDDMRSEGLLDHTIIVFTADHGVRREIVRPGDMPILVSPGRLDDRAFHVPLMIYVPRVLDRPVIIDAPTSHVDVQPTILDLLGIGRSRELEQGVPVWSSALKNRQLFLATAGAEGFCCDGVYYMKTEFGSVCESPTLHFESPKLLESGSDGARIVKTVLAEHAAQEHAILGRVLQSETAH